ncbi:hypothetical protein L195_g042095 [Trifolium pratense]|uniref:Uncharacterized protein n=1 Tax=Trifolium pratense TaxID=57577 RepID=A0A2K3M5H2_TRIPR|nr:hypothetical protein L195_g042095 [Trifolium pratense]
MAPNNPTPYAEVANGVPPNDRCPNVQLMNSYYFFHFKYPPYKLSSIDLARHAFHQNHQYMLRNILEVLIESLPHEINSC